MDAVKKTGTRMDTKKLATLSMLVALAFVVMALSKLLPSVNGFLDFDFKDVVLCIGGFVYGPVSALMMIVVVCILEMLSPWSDTGYVGCIMNIVQTVSFACTAAAIYRKRRTLGGAVAGLLAGCAVMAAVMMLWNYFLTPLYMGYPREAVVELLLPAFLPFNLLKGGLNASLTFLLYKPVVTALRKSGFVPAADPARPGGKPTGLLLAAAFVAASCILFILSWNGII